MALIPMMSCLWLLSRMTVFARIAEMRLEKSFRPNTRGQRPRESDGFLAPIGGTPNRLAAALILRLIAGRSAAGARPMARLALRTCAASGTGNDRRPVFLSLIGPADVAAEYRARSSLLMDRRAFARRARAAALSGMDASPVWMCSVALGDQSAPRRDGTMCLRGDSRKGTSIRYVHAATQRECDYQRRLGKSSAVNCRFAGGLKSAITKLSPQSELRPVRLRNSSLLSTSTNCSPSIL